MGCAISNFHNHLIDLSKRSNLSKNTNNALIVAPHNLYRFLQENNPHPKCIFIFGKNPIHKMNNYVYNYSNMQISLRNNWLLTLLKQEIERQNHGPYENIFIINLIPNRITLFRQCLFLRQTPSFINFDYNYVAIKLIRHSTRRKELEIKNNGIIIGANTFDDNVDDNYTNYFRATNKLYEIRVKNAEDRIRLRLSTSNKTAIPISNRQELISFIQMPKKDLLEINISEFHFNQRMETILDRCRQQTLLFIINNEIDLDDNIKLLIINNNNNQDRQQQYDLIFLRKFIQLYRLTSYALKFV
ncbi:hypothetical protein DERF_006208 [Dermatophagoides farinae]|uniref:Uncharacterized protein n=1 Tax=Dermatophagoides farinae TaxID=6954 RepID=A0A922L6Y4_DERFA|nr:hypothetical protein DERF_006208 [Dermatophagoides farinae]